MSMGASHYLALSRRSIVNTIRQPISIVPALTFPLMFLALNSAALAESINLPGFPRVDSFLQFMVATTIMQGALFGSIAAGADMARDIEGGFFDRLIATPVARTAILVGRVAGAFVLSFAQAWIFFGAVTIFGLEVEGGLLGMLGVALLAGTLGAGFGSVSMSFALKTGSSEAVQGSFPALFIFLFLSSAFFPRELMTGWFQDVATMNPLSHLIESARHLVISGWDTGEWLGGLGIAASIFALGILVSGRALAGRLAESA